MPAGGGARGVATHPGLSRTRLHRRPAIPVSARPRPAPSWVLTLAAGSDGCPRSERGAGKASDSRDKESETITLNSPRYTGSARRLRKLHLRRGGVRIRAGATLYHSMRGACTRRAKVLQCAANQVCIGMSVFYRCDAGAAANIEDEVLTKCNERTTLFAPRCKQKCGHVLCCASAPQSREQYPGSAEAIFLAVWRVWPGTRSRCRGPLGAR